jgi:hypothetical protein
MSLAELRGSLLKVLGESNSTRDLGRRVFSRLTA